MSKLRRFRSVRTRGDIDHIEALQLLCRACNSLKGDRTPAELIAILWTGEDCRPVLRLLGRAFKFNLSPKLDLFYPSTHLC